MDDQFKDYFPKLADVEKKKTSEIDPKYNCIAWAFRDTTRHWWPNQRRSYWPHQVAGKSTLEAFQGWFAADGWEETTSTELELGYEKVALFAKEGVPTHAARLLDTGLWTSKLGQHIDISHAIEELDGPQYGAVLKVYRKLRIE